MVEIFHYVMVENFHYVMVENFHYVMVEIVPLSSKEEQM